MTRITIYPGISKVLFMLENLYAFEMMLAVPLQWDVPFRSH